MKLFVRQHGDLNARGTLQPVEADERITNVIRASKMEDQSSRRFRDRL